MICSDNGLTPFQGISFKTIITYRPWDFQKFIFSHWWSKTRLMARFYGFSLKGIFVVQDAMWVSSWQLQWLCTGHIFSNIISIKFESSLEHCTAFILNVLNHKPSLDAGVVPSQITSNSTICSTVCSDTHQRKHQNFASLASVMGIHRWPVGSLTKCQ